jgi:hypothetical protein
MNYWDAAHSSKQALLKVNSHQIDDGGKQTGRHDTLQPCAALVWANQLADKAASVGIGTGKMLQFLQDLTTPPDV